MAISYVKKCPECGGINLVLDKERGEVHCRDCGLVIEEKMVDFGQEWREFDHEQSTSRRRTGGPMTYSVDYAEPLIVKKGDKIEILPIGEFVDGQIRKNNDAVIKDDDVEYLALEKEFEAVAFDKNYEVAFRSVREVSRHPIDNVYEIKLETGRKVNVTGSHSVFTVNENKVVPVIVEELKEGDFVVAPLELPSVKDCNTELNLLDNFIEVSDKYKNIYLRNFGDESVFRKARKIFGNRLVRTWKSGRTIPLWILKDIKCSIKSKKNYRIGIYSSNNELPAKIETTPEFCKLLGYYTAEGHCSEHDVVFSFGNHEEGYINEVKENIGKIFDLKIREHKPHESAVQLEVNSKLLRILFKDILKMGSNARTKRVPNLIYSLPREHRLQFLEGYFNGDGSFVRMKDPRMIRPQVCLSTNSVSAVLTNDVLTLYSQLGFNANYQEVELPGHIIEKTGQFVKDTKTTRSLITNPETVVELGYLELEEVPKNKGRGVIEKFIPAPNKYKREWKHRNRIRIERDLALKIAGRYYDKELMKLANAPFLFLRVISMRKVKPTNGFVYDISVPECENFVGGRGGIFLHNTKFDRGLGTDVGKKSDIYQLGGKERNRFFRLRKWQYRISTAIERNLKLALAELKRVSSYLKLPKAVEEESARIYTLAVQRGLVRGRSMESVVAGALYAACRRHEVPRTLDELSEASGIDKKEIGRTYRFVTRELGIRILPSNPVDYLARFASALKLNAETQSRAVDILEKAQNSELTSGRGPTGIAAASLYVAALMNNEKRTQREVADVAGVTEVTIRNRYKELLKKLKLDEKVKKKVGRG